MRERQRQREKLLFLMLEAGTITSNHKFKASLGLHSVFKRKTVRWLPG